MRKMTALLTAVVLMLSLSFAVFAVEADGSGVTWREVDETVYATTAVNVRSGPGTKYSRIGGLAEGDAVRRTAVGSNGWSKVEYMGEEGYVASSYLSKSKTDRSGSVDYDDLTDQVAIARGLKAQDYTKDSWAAVQTALEEGESALRSKKQSRVDDAYYDLEAAIAQLVPMDYSALWAVLRKVEGLNEPDEAYDIWAELVLAVEAGRDLLSSGDQEAVDAGVTQLEGLLEAVKTYQDSLDDPLIVTKEVQVEVPPTGDYCNVESHRVCQILLIVSGVLNVALAALVVGMLKKKQKQADDTPLIDYDIDDDIYEI